MVETKTKKMPAPEKKVKDREILMVAYIWLLSPLMFSYALAPLITITAAIIRKMDCSNKSSCSHWCVVLGYPFLVVFQWIMIHMYPEYLIRCNADCPWLYNFAWFRDICSFQRQRAARSLSSKIKKSVFTGLITDLRHLSSD